jgi:hypothetical protein
MIVVCSKCGKEMLIDQPNGVAYITDADGLIFHDVCPEVPAEEPPLEGNR